MTKPKAAGKKSVSIPDDKPEVSGIPDDAPDIQEEDGLPEERVNKMLEGEKPLEEPVKNVGAMQQAKAQQKAAADLTAAKELKAAAKAAEKPKEKPKRSRAEILAEIEAESLSRVNIDEFLDARSDDPYYIPPHMIPDGFTLEWKTTHIMGQPVDQVYSAYNVRLRQGGWREAPAELFPGLVPDGYDRPNIERPGVILMMRPEKITNAIREADYNRAIAQLNDKMAQLYQTPANSMDRVVTKKNKYIEGRLEAKSSGIPGDRE